MGSYFKKRLNQFEVDEYREVAEYPKNALIEVTNSCNHKCVFCKSSNQLRRATYLDLSVFRRFVEEAAELGLEEVGLYGTGEPFMVKNIHEFIGAAKTAGVRRVYLTSNGALATRDRVKKCVEAGLDSIKFSINAGNAQDYYLIHGSDDFDTVLENVVGIHEWVQAENIPLQMLGSCVAVPSLGHIHEEHRQHFAPYFEDIQYVIASSQGGQAFDISLHTDDLSAVFDRNMFQANDGAVSPCSMLWNRYHLTAEGYLTACCVDYDLNLAFGELSSASLADAWNNEKIKSLRRKHIEGKLEGTICDQCIRNKKSDYAPIMEVAKKTKPDQLLDREKAELHDRIRHLSSRS